MSRTERREYAVGIIATLAIVAILGVSAMANRRRVEGNDTAFHVSAEFGRADGVSVGTPVRIAGLDLGKVIKMSLDDRRRALVVFQFPRTVELPDDSSASIQTDGLFGQKYVEVQPGGSDTLLKSGGRISYVQDSVILEDLINTIVARAKASRGEAGQGSAQ